MGSIIIKAPFLKACRDRLLSPWGLWLGYLLITIAKAPSLFWAPRFWAEEGIIYYLQARTAGWSGALFAMPLGYLSLPANLAGVLANELPLMYAPYGGLMVSLGIQMLLPWVVLANGYFARDRLRQGLMLLIPILVIQSFETWLNAINGQFWLALAAAYVLASPGGEFPPRRHVANGFTLLMAGLSGPVSAFLAPLFVLRGIIERRWVWCIYALPVALGGVMAVAGQSSGGRALSFPLDVFAYASLFHVFLNNLCVSCAVALFPKFAGFAEYFGIALVLVVAAFIWAWWKANSTGRWLIFAASVLLVLSFVGMLGKEQFLHGDAISGARYFFASAALFFSALLCFREPARRVPLLLLALLSINALQFTIRYPVLGEHDGKDWAAGVEAYRKAVTDVIYFNPPMCGFAPDAPDAATSQPRFLVSSASDLIFVAGSGERPLPQNVYLYRTRLDQPVNWQRFNGEWNDTGLFLFGLSHLGRCYGGDQPAPVPGVRVSDGKLVFSRADVGSPDGYLFLLGHGESFGAMLARNNYFLFFGDDLARQLPPAAPAQKRVTEKASFSPALVGGVALDFCARWGMDCGQSAADAFCLAQGFDFATTYSVQLDAPPTRVISTGQLCETPGCNSIRSVVCARRTVGQP